MECASSSVSNDYPSETADSKFELSRPNLTISQKLLRSTYGR